MLRPPFFVFARRVGRDATLGASFRLLFRKCVLIIPYRYYLRRLFAKSNEITSPIGAHLPHPTGKSFRFLCLGASFRLLFRKCVLLCLQVLPAPPFRKIKRNYVADRGTSPVPDGQIFSLSLLRRVLPPAFPQMRLDNTNRYYLRRFRKIKRNYVADRSISPAPTGKSFRLLCLGASFRSLFRKCVLLCLQVLPAPFSQNQTKSHRR